MLIEPILIYISLVTILLLATGLMVLIWFLLGTNSRLNKALARKDLKVDHDQLAELIEDRLATLISKYALKADKIARDSLAKYQQALLIQENQAIESIKYVSKDIEITLKDQLTAFGSGFKQKINLAYENMVKEIEAEKKQRLIKLDEEIMEIIRQVAEEILGKSINSGEHKELIFEALEKAKKKGIFK